MLSERDMSTFGYLPGSGERENNLRTAQSEVWSVPNSPLGRTTYPQTSGVVYDGRMSMAAMDQESLIQPGSGQGQTIMQANRGSHSPTPSMDMSVSSMGATRTPPLSPKPYASGGSYAPRNRASSADWRGPHARSPIRQSTILQNRNRTASGDASARYAGVTETRQNQRQRHHRVQSDLPLMGGANFFDLASMGLEQLSAPSSKMVNQPIGGQQQVETVKEKKVEKNAKDNESNLYIRTISRRNQSRSASHSPLRVAASVLGVSKANLASKPTSTNEATIKEIDSGKSDNITAPGFNFDAIWKDELQAVPISQTENSQRQRTNTVDSGILKDSQRDNVADTSKSSRLGQKAARGGRRSHRRAVSMPSVKGVSAIFGAGVVLGGTSPTEPKEGVKSEAKVSLKDAGSGIQVADALNAETPKTTPMSSVRNEDNLRTCEFEPSEHQVELPNANDVLMYSRIVSLAESYRIVDQNFEFDSLAGLSRFYLESALRGTDPTVTVGGGGDNVLVSSHKPIIKSFLDCAEDLVLEGFFKSGGDAEHERIEVAIFSSQTHRQFIVSYRGTTEQQLKPVSTKHAKQKDDTGAISILHPEHPVPVNPIIKKAYFADEMENKVFATLNKLTGENPFFDVVTTGHSFGAMLATIAGIRYASQFPIMRVSSIVFGSPRIGGEKFRDLANTLPNFRLMRIEQGDDDWVSMPEGSKWEHAGHAVVIDPAVSASNSLTTTSVASSERTQDTSSKEFVVAYKFDKKRPTSVSHFFGMHKPKKGDSNIMSYMHTVEKFTHMGFPWVKSFFGENRDGVSGSNMETRHVV